MLKFGRTIIAGDLHGCYDEFEELLKKIQYLPKVDRLILCGDLLDRGPESVACVRKARELNLECVKGNHEVKFLKWFRSSGTNLDVYDAHPHYMQFSDEDITYMTNMPYYIKVSSDLWVVHAGVKPGLPLEQQKNNDLAYLRYTDKDRNMISLKKIAKGQIEGAMFWTEFGPFGTNIIYGHHVHSMENIKVDRFDDGTACYGIDTGCVFGGNLSCIITSNNKDFETVQVKAKKEYFKGWDIL